MVLKYKQLLITSNKVIKTSKVTQNQRLETSKNSEVSLHTQVTRGPSNPELVHRFYDTDGSAYFEACRLCERTQTCEVCKRRTVNVDI